MEVNIWTHLLGAIGFGILAGVASFDYLKRYPTSSNTDIAVFACFFGGSVMCLGMSASVLPFERRRLINIVSHDTGTFTACGAMGVKVGLPRDYDLNYGIFLSQCVLWILLFSALAKDLLDYGITRRKDLN
jgi:hypothetical protein